MADYPFLPWFVDTYLADTMHLTLEENGAYSKLTALAWMSENCSIPDDDEWIERVLGITKRAWQKLRPKVLAFWYKTTDGNLTQKKLVKARQKAIEISQKRRGAAIIKWEKESHKSLIINKGSDANALQMQPKSNTPKPISTPITINNISDDSFEKLWEIYPRRANKHEAEKEWGIACAKETPEKILAAVKEYLKNTDPKYIFYPDKFLRDEKWRDYMAAPNFLFPEWLEAIKSHPLGGDNVALFMRDCKFERTGEKSATIYCPSEFIRQRIENNHEQVIRWVHEITDLEIIVGESPNLTST